MPLPEGYLPREGDVLILHGTVCYNVRPSEDGLKVFLRPQGYYSDIRVPLEDIVGIFSRKWDGGDRVRVTGMPEVFGDVVTAQDGFVWVKVDPKCGYSADFITAAANDLEAMDPVDESFVEEPPPPPAPPAES